MKSQFLEGLKKAADTGEFNSEAAKKINEIDELANKKKNAFGLVGDRIEKSGYAESVTEEEAEELNSEYEKKMEKIKKQDVVNIQLATLIDIEHMVKLSVEDMMSFVNELEDNFSKEIEEENPMYGELSLKIENIKSKYNSIINN